MGSLEMPVSLGPRILPLLLGELGLGLPGLPPSSWAPPLLPLALWAPASSSHLGPLYFLDLSLQVPLLPHVSASPGILQLSFNCAVLGVACPALRERTLPDWALPGSAFSHHRGSHGLYLCIYMAARWPLAPLGG